MLSLPGCTARVQNAKHDALREGEQATARMIMNIARRPIAPHAAVHIEREDAEGRERSLLLLSTNSFPRTFLFCTAPDIVNNSTENLCSGVQRSAEGDCR